MVGKHAKEGRTYFVLGGVVIFKMTCLSLRFIWQQMTEVWCCQKTPIHKAILVVVCQRSNNSLGEHYAGATPMSALWIRGRSVLLLGGGGVWRETKHVCLFWYELNFGTLRYWPSNLDFTPFISAGNFLALCYVRKKSIYLWCFNSPKHECIIGSGYRPPTHPLCFMSSRRDQFINQLLIIHQFLFCFVVFLWPLLKLSKCRSLENYVQGLYCAGISLANVTDPLM
jgi:hypothetical protein